MTKTAIKLEDKICRKYPHCSFIVNAAFLGNKPTTRLKCLWARLENGNEVADVPYTMPTDAIYVNATDSVSGGYIVKWDILLENPGVDPRDFAINGPADKEKEATADLLNNKLDNWIRAMND